MEMTKNFSWDRIRLFVWIGLAAAGALLRSEYLREFSGSVLFAAAVGPDVAEYHEWAVRILSGQLLPQTLPIHAPLYPFFLSGIYAVFGISVPAARIVQLVLNFGAWLLLAFLLRRTVERKLPRLRLLPEIFLALAMLVPVTIYYQAELVCESLLLPLFSLLLLFHTLAKETRGAERLLFFTLSGFCCGLAVITHPMTLGAAGLLLAADAFRVWEKRAEWGALLFCILAFLLPVAAVSAVHTAIAGRPVFIQGNGAFNLYLGHGPGADGGCRLRPGKAWNGFHAEVQKEARTRGLSPDAVLLGRIAGFYRENPEQLPLLFCRKAMLVFSPRERISGADPEPVLFATAVQQTGRQFLIVILPLALLGAALFFRRRNEAAVFLPWLCWGAGLFLMQCLTVSSGRYRTAMFPVFYLLAAYALLELTSSVSRKQWRPWLCEAVLVIVFAVFYVRSAPGKQAETESHVLYAEGALAQGKPAEALAHYAAVRRLAGDDTLYAAPVGRAKELLGDPDGALTEYRKSAASSDVNGWVNCGVIYLKKGETARAGACFTRAVRHPGANANAFYNYGVFLCDFTPRKEEGLAAIRRAAELDPAHADAWNRLGAVAFMQRDYRRAVRCFEQASALRPADRNFLRNLMAAYGAAGRIQQAETVKEKLRRMEAKKSAK